MMDLPVSSWLDAGAVRVSRRSFAVEAPGEELLGRLEHVCREFRPFPEARAALVREPVDKVAAGIIGGYGRVSGAPCYLAFIGRMDSGRVQECVGYTGEALILEATALGLATCWVGGLFKPAAVSSRLGLWENEKVICISPVGYPKAKPSLTDRTFKAIAGSARRKPLEELMEGGRVPEGGMKTAVEAARLSPSANNRQPWRFRTDGRAVTVFTDNDKREWKLSRRLDCGIAMLHFELGARAAGLPGEWEFLEAPEVARYVLSANSFS
ncbi:MAG: nitroreductase family protein [Acidobacteria bacterium]|nr:nitroreductase family protein [Acidobacteriota bacterium]